MPPVATWLAAAGVSMADVNLAAAADYRGSGVYPQVLVLTPMRVHMRVRVSVRVRVSMRVCV